MNKCCGSVLCWWYIFSISLTLGHHSFDSKIPCGFRVEIIDPLHFLAGCRTRRLNQVYICLSYILACFIVLLFIRAPFYILLVFVDMCSLFWLFWLSYQYLPSDWLECHLWEEGNRGKAIVSRKPRPKSAHDFLGLLYCFIVLLCICVISWPYMIYFPTAMARYSLFVPKVPLNSKQTHSGFLCLVGSHLWFAVNTHWRLGIRESHVACTNPAYPWKILVIQLNSGYRWKIDRLNKYRRHVA